MVSPLRHVLSGLNIPRALSSTLETTISRGVTVQVCHDFRRPPQRRLGREREPRTGQSNPHTPIPSGGHENVGTVLEGSGEVGTWPKDEHWMSLEPSGPETWNSLFPALSYCLCQQSQVGGTEAVLG